MRRSFEKHRGSARKQLGTETDERNTREAAMERNVREAHSSTDANTAANAIANAFANANTKRQRHRRRQRLRPRQRQRHRRRNWAAEKRRNLNGMPSVGALEDQSWMEVE